MDAILRRVTLSLAGVLLPLLTHASTTTIPSDGHNFDASRGIFMSLVMLGVIALIASEKIQRTLIVFFVASALIFMSYSLGHFFPWFNFISLESAFASIDGQVIGLLIGMMIIVGVMSHTNVFQWLAVKMFEVSKGRFVPLYFTFFFVTAFFSAFLDNVTMMFLVTPVAISIARIFDVSPVKFVLAMIFASNIGGTATLIGDPPNIMIGSYAGLSFNAFLMNLGLPIFFLLIIVSISAYMMMRSEFCKARTINSLDTVTATLREQNPLKHRKLLIASVGTLIFVILGFFFHSYLHMPAAVAALMGAALLMLIRDRLIRRKFGKTHECKEMMEERIHHTFSKDVEWLVIGFFVFLFMIVGAVEHTGVLNQVALFIQDTFGDNLLLCALAILWIAAIASMLLDNIPFTAVMLPVVGSLVEFYAGQGMNAQFLWWALALGACLGGNGTLIGASANLVGAALLEKEKYHLSFGEFFKYGFPLTIIQILFSTVVIYIMYLIAA